MTVNDLILDLQEFAAMGLGDKQVLAACDKETYCREVVGIEADEDTDTGGVSIIITCLLPETDEPEQRA